MRACVRVYVCEYPVARPAESDLLLHMCTYVWYVVSAAAAAAAAAAIESLDSRSVTLDELSDTHVASKTVAELNLQTDESFQSPTVKEGILVSQEYFHLKRYPQSELISIR